MAYGFLGRNKLNFSEIEQDYKNNYEKIQSLSLINKANNRIKQISLYNQKKKLIIER